MASEVVTPLQPENVFAALAQLNISGEEPRLDGEFRGGECHIFKVPFREGNSVAVRVPLYWENIGTPEAKIEELTSELRLLQALEAKGFSWSPKCLGASLMFDNPIKHPFLALTWIDGGPLRWSEESPPREVRDKVLRQMAAIQKSLIERTLEHRITAMQYFERKAKNRYKRVEEGKIPGLSVKDCDDQQALLGTVLGDHQDDTAFAIDHGDFKPDNVIVDGEFNIRGIIDWGFANLTPIPRAAGLPAFLWRPSVSENPSAVVIQDRKAYTSFSPQSSSIASYMKRWQTADDADFCTLFLASLFSKGTHIQMVEAGWKLP